LAFRSEITYYPALARKIVELATPSFILKQLLVDVPLVAGSSITINKEKGSRGVGLFETPEGAEAIVDVTPYESVQVTPKKYVIADFLTKEMLEDVEPIVALTEAKLRRLARRYAYQVEKSIADVLEAGAENTITATGKSLFYTGTEVTLTGTIGQYDILEAIKAIENKNLVPEFLVVSPTRAVDIIKLPHFSSAVHYGEAVNLRGVLGTVLGLTVLKTPVVPTNRAYVVSSGANPSGAWEPLGFFVWKRPLTVDLDYEKKTERYIIYVSSRFAPIITSGAGISKITIGT
jgi:hypothetical protein